MKLDELINYLLNIKEAYGSDLECYYSEYDIGSYECTFELLHKPRVGILTKELEEKDFIEVNKLNPNVILF